MHKSTLGKHVTAGPAISNLNFMKKVAVRNGRLKTFMVKNGDDRLGLLALSRGSHLNSFLWMTETLLHNMLTMRDAVRKVFAHESVFSCILGLKLVNFVNNGEGFLSESPTH